MGIVDSTSEQIFLWEHKLIIILALDKAKEIWETLNCPAAQQMLIYHKANTEINFPHTILILVI